MSAAKILSHEKRRFWSANKIRHKKMRNAKKRERQRDSFMPVQFCSNKTKHVRAFIQFLSIKMGLPLRKVLLAQIGFYASFFLSLSNPNQSSYHELPKLLLQFRAIKVKRFERIMKANEQTKKCDMPLNDHDTFSSLASSNGQNWWQEITSFDRFAMSHTHFFCNR